jgi:hypothetical protein
MTLHRRPDINVTPLIDVLLVLPDDADALCGQPQDHDVRIQEPRKRGLHRTARPSALNMESDPRLSGEVGLQFCQLLQNE